jgi:hypothetical protein
MQGPAWGGAGLHPGRHHGPYTAPQECVEHVRTKAHVGPQAAARRLREGPPTLRKRLGPPPGQLRALTLSELADLDSLAPRLGRIGRFGTRSFSGGRGTISAGAAYPGSGRSVPRLSRLRGAPVQLPGIGREDGGGGGNRTRVRVAGHDVRTSPLQRPRVASPSISERHRPAATRDAQGGRMTRRNRANFADGAPWASNLGSTSGSPAMSRQGSDGDARQRAMCSLDTRRWVS